MKTRNALLLALLIAVFSVSAFSQAAPVLKRTTYKTDKLEFGSGGTLAVTGAPVGSVRVEGWKNPEIEISAEIEVSANTEADLAKLSEVTTFVLQESLGRTSIISVGTHDKQFVKKLGKKFPKHLVGMPFRIDYVIKVPQYCDLIIDGGHGDLTISGVDGTFRLNYIETNAKLNLRGGALLAVFGKGVVDMTIPTPAWRGRFADIQLASGDMNIRLPNGINAELDATILRSGKIENNLASLKPRARTAEFTDKSIAAKAGVGGTSLKFTVGDGTMKITSMESSL